MHLVGIIEICQQMGFSLVIKTARPEDPSGIIKFTSNITVALKGKVSPSCLVTSRSVNVDNTFGHKYLCFLIPDVSNIGSVGQIRPISKFEMSGLTMYNFTNAASKAYTMVHSMALESF